jgi:Cd2+/Zn2+-exporting ATPase
MGSRSVAGLATAWVLLAVAGAALCFNTGLPLWTPSAAVAAVYALLGTPELVHVLYELARGQINIHALTTVAVFGERLRQNPIQPIAWVATEAPRSRL